MRMNWLDLLIDGVISSWFPSAHLTALCAFQMEEEDEFSTGIILPPLIVQLKKILEQYPDDSQILKVSCSG